MTSFHALDLASEKAKLHVLTDGTWKVVAEVALTDARAVQELAAAIALPGPILLRLPADQAIRVGLAENAAADAALATDPRLADVAACWALSQGGDGADTRAEIVAVPDAVIAEISGFAAALGLAPAWVTVAHRPARSGDDDPPWLGVPLGASAPPAPPWTRATAPPTLAPPDRNRSRLFRQAPSEAPALDPAPAAGHSPVQPTTTQASRHRLRAQPAAVSPVKVAGITARARAVDTARRDPARVARLQDPLDEDAARVDALTRDLLRKARRGNWMPTPRVLRGAMLSVVLLVVLATIAFWPPVTPNDPQGAVALVAAGDADSAEFDAEADTDIADAADLVGAAEAPALRADRNAMADADTPADGLTDAVFYTPPPGLADPLAIEDLAGLEQPAIDPSFQADALALPIAETGERRATPASLPAPGPVDAVFVVDERGLVKPSVEGRQAPEGYMVYAGAPPRQSLPRPERDEEDLALLVVTDRGTLAEDDPLRRLSPRARPDDLSENFQRATLGGRTETELAILRPAIREASEQEARAAIAPEAGATALAATVSPRPKLRTADALQAFTTASAAREARGEQRTATRAAAEPVQVLQTAAVMEPTAPTPARAQKEATANGRIDLSKLNLLGTYGSARAPRALVRMPNGRVLNLAVGDQVDGGRVASIADGRLNYVKSGRTLTLQMPRG